MKRNIHQPALLNHCQPKKKSNMKKNWTIAACVIAAISTTAPATAGNKDRTGQAGATELLVNPWGASTGTFGQNTSFVQGLEAMKGNIAGLAYVDNTEIGVAYTAYLRGSKVSVNNLGLAQRLGNAGVLGINIQSMSFGEIDVTNFNNPSGGVGSYTPQFFNLQAGFAKEFSRGIHAGIGLTYVSEQISNVKASGACFEAGVQYLTGRHDNFHFGVTLRNVGTNMRFTGEGFSTNYDAQDDDQYLVTRQTPADKFQMPTYLNISAAYDFYLDANKMQNPDEKPKHRLTVMGAFTSNSFLNDYIGGGLEYSFREIFTLRGGYRYEKAIADKELSQTMYTGLAGGVTIKAPHIGSKGPALAIDYSFRQTHRPDNGVHTFSIRFMRPSKRAAQATDAAATPQ